MTIDLFTNADEAPPPLRIAEGAVLLPGFALPHEGALHDALVQIFDSAPLRHMLTPAGLRMSVATTSCGALGWITDRRGYRYSALDPLSGQAWPSMPGEFMQLAQQAASAAGFDGFAPDACLINRYAPGARMSLHQDRDERDFGQPIVSVSLGLPAVFQFGGAARADKAQRVPLAHGDVVVWGGPARLRFHGVLPLEEGVHPFMGDCRINLTFRKAG